MSNKSLNAYAMFVMRQLKPEFQHSLGMKVSADKAFDVARDSNRWTELSPKERSVWSNRVKAVKTSEDSQTHPKKHDREYEQQIARLHARNKKRHQVEAAKSADREGTRAIRDQKMLAKAGASNNKSTCSSSEDDSLVDTEDEQYLSPYWEPLKKEPIDKKFYDEIFDGAP